MACPKPDSNHSLAPAYAGIAKRIGVKLRDIYSSPEAEPLPVNHVELLLQLRQKERERARAKEAA